MRIIIFACVGLTMSALPGRAEFFYSLKELSECSEKVGLEETSLQSNLAFCWKTPCLNAGVTNACGAFAVLSTNGAGRVRSFVQLQGTLYPSCARDPWTCVVSYMQNAITVKHNAQVGLFRADQETALRSGCAYIPVPAVAQGGAEEGGRVWESAAQKFNQIKGDFLMVFTGVVPMLDCRPERWFKDPRHGPQWRLLEYAIGVSEEGQTLSFLVSHRICIVDSSFSPSFGPVRMTEFKDCDIADSVPLQFRCKDAPEVDIQVESRDGGRYCDLTFSSEGFVRRKEPFSVDDAKKAVAHFRRLAKE